jgi:hypothetical protein
MVAMGEVEQMLHRHKRVAESLGGGDPLLGVYQ